MYEELYMEPEGVELNESQLPKGKAWNFQVSQIYSARVLKIFRDAEHKTQVYLDGRGIRVAIVDTGIDDSNPDLVDRVKDGINYSSRKQADKKDYDGHGTWVAGLVGGRNKHRGIASGTDLLPVKVAEGGVGGRVFDLERGIRWASKNSDIIVIPRSLYGESDQILKIKEACGKAMSNGVAVIASAGNCFYSARWPAGWTKDYALSIGSVGLSKEKIAQMKQSPEKGEEMYVEASETHHVSASNKWPYIDFVAPGVCVIGPWLGDKYYEGSGTSIAAPQFAGVLSIGLSLVRQAGEKVSLEELENLLAKSAFKYNQGQHLFHANYLRKFLDPDEMIFKDDKSMQSAMFGSGLVQTKDFIIMLCELINSRSEKQKLFIDESTI